MGKLRDYIVLGGEIIMCVALVFLLIARPIVKKETKTVIVPELINSRVIQRVEVDNPCPSCPTPTPGQSVIRVERPGYRAQWIPGSWQFTPQMITEDVVVPR